MGKAALSGQPGVISVQNGWFGGKEINTVVYDPDRITVKKIEKLLRGTGTYRSTVPGPE